MRFGEQLVDVSDDEAELAGFLESARAREQAAPEPGDEGFGEFEGEFDADPDPGFAAGGMQDRIIPDSVFDPPKGRGPSARLFKDIQAKTALFLLPLASVWKARDEYCGTVAVESIPEVSAALTAIFVDSPDVVKWFTASGKYMKWLDLAMAFQQLGTAVTRHHITHRAHDEETGEPDWSAYAAG